MSKKERKIIVTAAVTGAIHTPTMSPYLPCGVAGISQAAIDAANAGASMVHVHAREDNGKPTSDIDTYGAILSRIHANTDVIIGISTGGAIGMSVEERLATIPVFKPEIVSFNSGSINFNLSGLVKNIEGKAKYDWEVPFLQNSEKNVFQNTFADMKKCFQIMHDAGTVPEFEVFDLGQLNNIHTLYKQGYVQTPLYFQFVPGIMGGIPMKEENLLYFVNHIKADYGDQANFSMVAGGRRAYRFETLSVIMGGNMHVGLEDSLYIKPNGELAVSNAQQVEKVIKILHDLDYEIATPDEAREILHTKGKDKVNF